MNTKDVSNLLVFVGLMNQFLTQAKAVSDLIAAKPDSLDLNDLKPIVAKRDAAIEQLDRAIAEAEANG